MADKLFTTYWTELAAAALAHADAVGVEDTGGLYTATNVEAALAEVKTIADAAVTPAEAAAAYQPLDADLTALAAAGNSGVLAATTASFLTADETKLDGIESGAQVNTVTATSTTVFTNKTLDSFTNDIEADAVHVQVRNESGSPLTKGTPVYVSGYSVGQDIALVSAADASALGTSKCIGLLQDDIATNATGSCLVSGRISGVNTSSFTAGDIVFLSETTGALTTTRPTGGAYVVQIGEVLRSHASLGVIDIDRSKSAISGFGATLVDDADASTARTTLGLGNAATLTVDADIATLSLPASTTISAFGATLVDDADQSTARTTLGLGTMATATATDYQTKATFPGSISVALSDMTTQITTGTTKAYWVNPFDTTLTITKVKATLATSGSGSTVVDINEGAGAGTSILSTKITIDASETDSDDATTPPVISDTSIAADGRLTFDIDTAGTSAAGLMVHIMFTRAV